MEAQILGLELSNDFFLRYLLGIVVDDVEEVQGLEFEGKHVTFHKASSDNPGQIRWCRSGPGDSASHLNNFRSKGFDILNWLLDEAHELEGTIVRTADALTCWIFAMTAA
jgi:hypothetical protein